MGLPEYVAASEHEEARDSYTSVVASESVSRLRLLCASQGASRWGSRRYKNTTDPGPAGKKKTLA